MFLGKEDVLGPDFNLKMRPLKKEMEVQSFVALIAFRNEVPQIVFDS
jgi:hypothetical protein